MSSECTRLQIPGEGGGHSQSQARVLGQEPDTLALIPKHEDYFVVGTYSLVADNAASENENSGRRQGFVQIMPFSSETDTSNVHLDRKDFPFGIYDIRFHPKFTDLIGVATSNAEILFFWLHTAYSDQVSQERLRKLELQDAGKIMVEDAHEDDGRLAIVTQFQFIDSDQDERLVHDQTGISPRHILLTATTQFGNTKLLKVTIPCPSESLKSSSLQITTAEQIQLDYQVITVHQQSLGLEAWTVMPLLIPSYQDEIQEQLLLFSGGDDSQFIVSCIDMPPLSTEILLPDLDLDLFTPKRVFADRRTHQAGIVSLCSLGSHPPRDSLSLANDTRSMSILVLTGSYDESLRLFQLSPPSTTTPKSKFELLEELKMDGGVWRIMLLDSYPSAGGPSESNDYILLIAGHTAGAFIVRLSITRTSSCDDDDSGVEDDTQPWKYEFKIEKCFKGHESLVYAVAAKKGQHKGAWDIVSASFYDRKICEWRWRDEKKLSHLT